MRDAVADSYSNRDSDANTYTFSDTNCIADSNCDGYPTTHRYA